MSANSERRPRIFLMSEDARRAAITPAAGASSDNIFPYEIMTAQERSRALDYYEMELEWFHWEYLSEGRSTRTRRGVDIIQTIAGNIQNLGLTRTFVKESQEAFRLLYHLVQCETRILDFDALPNASGCRRDFCEATKVLAKMAWKSVLRRDCLYRHRMSESSMRASHALFTSAYGV